ncbi:hypothetical protein ABIE65_000841 [Constrictibacter sp. MBR-5]|jgi:hypothetical protein|uniref:hypothetical protein n=1 Tax=Constrictibacter sp. MBR-5 TaxID=3156467 RepID=UPI0033915E94
MEWQPAPIRRRGIDQEQQLLEAARTLRDGWYVAHVHLSRISSVKRNENVVFALQMFEQAIRGIQGRLYVLRNGDWVYVYAGGHGAQVASAVSRLRQLFAGDPLYYNEEKYEADFATWYDLGHDRETFLAVAEELAGVDDAPQEPPRPGAVEAVRPAPAPPMVSTRVSELSGLAAVVDALERMNLAAFLRRQPVCALTSAGLLEKRFDEFYFSIGDIESSLNRTPIMTGEALLLQYVTKSLDRKLLALLKPACMTGESAGLSINLNVASALSNEFAGFDAGIPAAVRATIAFEFQFIDVFSDVGVYLYVRDHLRERGYRVYLDGVTDVNLPFVDPAALDVDGFKIRWSESIAEARGGSFAQLLARFDPARIMFCRCDSQRAMALGQSLGVRLYQGRYITEMLDAQRAAAARHAKVHTGGAGAA